MTENSRLIIFTVAVVVVTVLLVMAMEKVFPGTLAIPERAPNADAVSSYRIINPDLVTGTVTVYRIEIEGNTYYYLEGCRRAGLAPTPETIRKSFMQPSTE